MANYMDEARLEELWGLIKERDEAVAATANERAKIATGTYKGTGKYGASNPCIINCGFAPKFFVLMGFGSRSYDRCVYIGVKGFNYLVAHYSSQTVSGTASGTYSWWIENTFTDSGVSYYTAKGAAEQMNTSGATYYWVAIG